MRHTIFCAEAETGFAATLSIRNTDPKHPIMLMSVKYYDSDGKVVKKYMDKPAELIAMASTRYILPEGDTTGGSGANFPFLGCTLPLFVVYIATH